MRAVFAPVRAALFAGLIALGAWSCWTVAPQVDGWLFPVFDHEYLKPWDPDHPEALVSRQLDRVCWRTHVHKPRFTKAMRRSVVFVEPDGTRHFLGLLDGRTGEPASNKDAQPAGFDGDFLTCAYSGPLDLTQAFTIESSGRYLPPHGLWLIYHVSPLVHVPALIGGEP